MTLWARLRLLQLNHGRSTSELPVIHSQLVAEPLPSAMRDTALYCNSFTVVKGIVLSTEPKAGVEEVFIVTDYYEWSTTSNRKLPRAAL